MAPLRDAHLPLEVHVLRDIFEPPLPLGALALVASPHLVVVQPSRSRSSAAVDMLLDFVRNEAKSETDLLSPSMLLHTEDGMELIGDLGTAAGRLGMTAAARRLTGV